MAIPFCPVSDRQIPIYRASHSSFISTPLTLPMALQIALIASVCGVLAAVAPARRAAALDPAQAIRM